MIEVMIPGRGGLELEYLLLDLNGTIALDGEVLPGVASRLEVLSDQLEVHLVTADTHGKAGETAGRLGVQLARIEPLGEGLQKLALVDRLGAAQLVAIGNGTNDAKMLSEAALGIAVLGPESLAVEALRAADVVARSIVDAFDLLLYPRRLVATLRC